MPAWRTADADTSTSLADPWGIVGANLMLAAIVAGMGLFTQFQCDVFSLRFVAAQAVLAQMAAIGLLADGARAARLRQLTFVIGSVGAVCCGWSFLNPNVATMYDRTAVMAIALALCSGIFGLALAKIVRIRNAWTAAAESVTPGLLASSAAMLLLALSIEVGLYVSRGDSPAWPIALALLAMLGMLVVASLMAALVPGRDPLGLSESKRTAYVYAAEMFDVDGCPRENCVSLSVYRLGPTALARHDHGDRLCWYWIVGICQSPENRRIGWAASQYRCAAAVAAGTRFLVAAIQCALFVCDADGRRGVWRIGQPAEVVWFWHLAKRWPLTEVFGISCTIVLFRFDASASLAHSTGIVCVVRDILNRNRIASSTAASVQTGASAVIYVSSTAEIFLNGVGNAPVAYRSGRVVDCRNHGRDWLRIRSFLFWESAFWPFR
ncbi:MAG: hypothetical protein R3C28_12570 [Pirellulaceae bacterium]